MHSSPAEVTSAPEPAPEVGLPAETPPDSGPLPRSQTRLWIIAAVVALILGVLLFIGIRSKTSSLQSAVQISKDLNPASILRLKGTTEAVQTRAILAPVLEGQQVSTLTITKLLPAGTRVKRGDLMAEFDRQAQMRDSIDKEAEYNKLADQLAGVQAKESADRAKDETALKQAEDELHRAELEIQKAEIVSRIDAEKNQETLDEDKATFEQLRETFDLKRKAARAGIRILEIQRDRTRETMLHAQANADLMQIHAPIDGVVVLNLIFKQTGPGQVQEGDQVEPGTSFMQVIDPSAMQVRVAANQEDFLSLHIGQTAAVRLDAYPELRFSGRLEQQAPIAEAGDFPTSKVRTFAVIFSIQGNDPKLMPDLSAAVDVDLSGNQGTGSGS